MNTLQDKSIVLGITGGVAAYKAAELASQLTQAGARVDVIMTEAAQQFISPLTLRSLTLRPVATSLWEIPGEFDIAHISLAERADVVVVAPATANTIAKIACGLADNLLTSTILATRAPVIVAPAMNVNMWENPVTQENIAKLKARGFIIVGPDCGHLACGATGNGRLADPEYITVVIKQTLARNGDLAGKIVVITAGGTREAIDPVRFIGNRSSGKMGYALAEAARDRGAMVKLISTASLGDPAEVETVHVETAQQMKEAVETAITDADVLIMAAAVADYQVKEIAPQKIKKSLEGMVVELAPTADILASVKGSFVKVGFAAESQDLVANATKKMVNKGLDLVVANDITLPGSGFGAEHNKVLIIGRDGQVEDLPLMSKHEVADKILDAIVRLGLPDNHHHP
jgi:phosphopantothenoylcysteine decarboxylase / phosphopantothenate---cysteine ligase